MQRRELSLAARVGLAAGGAVAILAGVGLLVSGTPSTEARLGRVAGILMLLGIAGIALAIIGRL